MGFSVDVHHFVHPLTHPLFWKRSTARVHWYAHRWSLLSRICNTFKWQSVPWDEPGEEDDESSSDGFTCGQSRYNDFLAFINTASREGLLSTPEDSLHLTNRGGGDLATIYLPVEFPHPAKIENDPEWDDIVIGSSFVVARVLEELEPHCPQQHQGLHLQLWQEARKSIAKNLPLFIRW
jgi:hypothetical protein